MPVVLRISARDDASLTKRPCRGGGTSFLRHPHVAPGRRKRSQRNGRHHRSSEYLPKGSLLASSCDVTSRARPRHARRPGGILGPSCGGFRRSPDHSCVHARDAHLSRTRLEEREPKDPSDILWTLVVEPFPTILLNAKLSFLSKLVNFLRGEGDRKSCFENTTALLNGT